MNKTKIDWAEYSWNPISGCLHGCEYCYARKIATRFGGDFSMAREGKFLTLYQRQSNPYPDKFEPTFHKYRLDEPSRKTKGVNIFVCSMADLFGDWVPDEWIKEVFKACEKAPQHRYIFLTKNPSRFRDILPLWQTYHGGLQNMWFGTSATDDESFFENGYVLFEGSGYCGGIEVNRFMSIEPLLGAIRKSSLVNIKYLDWIIVGAETGNRKDKVIPKKEWIMEIKEQCQLVGVPLFMKESLRELMGQDFVQEFPWESDN